MSTNAGNQSTESQKIDLLVKILEETNALEPIAVNVVSSIRDIIKSGRASGKTDAEIAAQVADTDATELRVRSKSEDQMSDRP
jgi:hypothetical protein